MAGAFAVLLFQSYKPSFPRSGLDNARVLKNILMASRTKTGGKLYVCKNKADMPGNLATKNKISVRAKGGG